MTVCAAAIYTVDTTLGGRKLAVLGISDRMVTSGDVEFEPRQHTKIFGFVPAKAACLGSGDSSAEFSISTATHQEVIRSGVTDVGQIASLYSKNFTSLRLRRAEQTYLSPLGLDVESFKARQSELAPELVMMLEERMRQEELGVTAIIAGVDSGGPHIYSVGGRDVLWRETCYETCHDRSGFCSAGSGGRQFETLFMTFGYDTTWLLPAAMMLMYTAKKNAEKSPGVGRYTDMFHIDENGFALLSDATAEALEAYYQELETGSMLLRGKILERIAKDARLVRAPEESSPLANALRGA